MEDLTEGVVIKMMTTISGSNSLVIAERNEREDGNKTKRVKPVIWFETGKWNTIPNQVIGHYKPFGFYLVAIPWSIRKPSIIGEKRVNSGKCHVLHCVRKEHPIVKFGGKVGPISSFAPRINDRGVLIRGYYVGYHWNGNESLDEIPKHFSGKFTLKGKKAIPKSRSTFK
jgi:hypothetical protein